MNDLLELVLQEGAEELHLKTGRSPVMVSGGEPVAIDVPATTADNVSELFESIATREQSSELQKCGDTHFIFVFRDSSRFAVTAAALREGLEMNLKNLDR